VGALVPLAVPPLGESEAGLMETVPVGTLLYVIRAVISRAGMVAVLGVRSSSLIEPA
jgi:hypothetical protein